MSLPGPDGASGQVVAQASPAATAQPLLPDLQALPPSALYIVPAGNGRETRLKFTTVIWNAGPGPLEVRGGEDPVSGELAVYQVLYTADGQAVPGEQVGEFDFEHRHGHLHLGDFARYELWSTAADGSLAELVAVNEKVGFCLMDNLLVDSELVTGDGQARYPSDCRGDVQGISPGYGDIYVGELYEQDLVITGLPAGRYALVNIANPAGVIMETTTRNNSALSYLILEGGTVRID
jgi:hypothetical protein